MGIKDEIEEALNMHALWRKHFKDFLNGRAPFDSTLVPTADQCDLGNWLENEGHRLIRAELHDQIRVVHTEFHQIAAEIIEKIKEKRYAEAHEYISRKGPLNRASDKLSNLLLRASFHEGSGAVSPPPQEEPAPSMMEGEKPATP